MGGQYLSACEGYKFIGYSSSSDYLELTNNIEAYKFMIRHLEESVDTHTSIILLLFV